MTEDHLSNSPEIWKGIPGFPGYEASTHGRIRSFWKLAGKGRGWIIHVEPRRILRPAKDIWGYLFVSIGRRGTRRTIKVHQLVLITFVGPCPLGMEACHGDGIQANNFLKNLRWDTPSSNQLDRRKHGTAPIGENSGRAKLTDDQIIKIRALASQGHTRRELGAMFSVSHQNINDIVNRRSWTHVM